MKKLILLASFFLFSCGATHGQKMTSRESLVNQKWVLVEGLTVPIPEDASRRPNLTFSNDQVTGFSGCNRFFGGYTVSGRDLRFLQLGSTKMACIGDGGEIESQFLSRLSKVASHRIESGRLHLVTSEGSELILTPGNDL